MPDALILNTTVVQLVAGQVPMGPAGGDLVGSAYPNPVIAVGAVTDTKASLATKPIVRVVSVINVAALSALQTIDGISLVAGDLALLSAQTTASQNGPWVVAAGAWARPAWYPTGGLTQSFSGVDFYAREGSAYSGSVWYVTTAGAIVIDTTAITLTQSFISGSPDRFESMQFSRAVAQATVSGEILRIAKILEAYPDKFESQELARKIITAAMAAEVLRVNALLGGIPDRFETTTASSQISVALIASALRQLPAVYPDRFELSAMGARTDAHAKSTASHPDRPTLDQSILTASFFGN